VAALQGRVRITIRSGPGDDRFRMSTASIFHTDLTDNCDAQRITPNSDSRESAIARIAGGPNCVFPIPCFNPYDW